MKKPELLSPVGSMESFEAALEAGCNAIYLGGYQFGARSFATNFSREEIIEVIKESHLYDVKVYVTVNTLIYDSEVTTFMEYIDFLVENDVDALIMQDLGMIDLVRKTYPELDIHASTQMYIHNEEGVKFARSLGIKRVVLARETSIQDIKEIKKNNPDIELEIFVHGALCISYSGQCLMSSLIGGRSGNRGTCAQCCRQKYDLVTEEDNQFKKCNSSEYLLSTKDLNTLQYLGELIDAGVDSLKIEGRMKRPEYVYLITNIYNKVIKKYLKTKKIDVSENDIKEIKKIFNRKFTKGFIFNEENNNFTNEYRPNHMGIEVGKIIDKKNNNLKLKLIDDVSIGDGLRFVNQKEDLGITLNDFYKNKELVKFAQKGDIISFKYTGDVSIDDKVLKTTDYIQISKIKETIKLHSRKVYLKAKISLRIGFYPLFTITDGENIINVQGNRIIMHAKTSPIDEKRMLKQLSKTGNTPYEFTEIETGYDKNIFIAMGELNELRRKALDQLTKKRIYKTSKKKNKYSIELPNFNMSNERSILIQTIEQYNEVKKDKWTSIYTDKLDIYIQLKKDSRIKLIQQRVMNNFRYIEDLTMVNELGSLNFFPNVETDVNLNIVNSYSVAFLHSYGVKKVTLSYEMSHEQIKELIDNYHNRYNKHPNVEVITYSNIEVMISKYNLLNKYNIKSNKAFLRDKFNNLFPIRIKNKIMYIYFYKPNVIDNPKELYKIGVNSLRINLFDDTIINDIKNDIL